MFALGAEADAVIAATWCAAALPAIALKAVSSTGVPGFVAKALGRHAVKPLSDSGLKLTRKAGQLPRYCRRSSQ